MAQSNLIEALRARWNSPLEEDAPCAAVSFVLAGQNTFEDRGHAERTARTFAEATGVPCLAHVAAVPGGTGILSVAASNPDRYVSALECLTMAEEGLR